MGKTRILTQDSVSLAEKFVTRGRLEGMTSPDMAWAAGVSAFYVINRWLAGKAAMHGPTFDHLTFFLASLDQGVAWKDIPRRVKAENKPPLHLVPDSPKTSTTAHDPDVVAYVELFKDLEKKKRWALVHALLRTLEKE